MFPPEVTHKIDGTIHVVTVRGEVDIHSSPALVDALRKVSEAERLIVDLTECRYIDSSVFSALLCARKEFKGEMRLVVREGCNIRRVIAITQLDKIIPVVSTLDEAI